MPITAIDSNSALVVIDLQKGIVGRPTIHPVGGVVAQAVKLADEFRRRNQPVVLVRVGWAPDFSDAPKSRVQLSMAGAKFPPDFMEYLPELKADPAKDILIHKRQWGAFYGTDLDLHLRRRKVTQIVLCGISTSIGVESTARDAWERSYNLAFATDAMTDLSQEAHDRSMNIIFPRIGELGTTDEILTKL